MNTFNFPRVVQYIRRDCFIFPFKNKGHFFMSACSFHNRYFYENGLNPGVTNLD